MGSKGKGKGAGSKSGQKNGTRGAPRTATAPAAADSRSPTSILEAGMELKEEGNRLFKSNDYAQAIRRYKRAILLTRGLASGMRGMAMFAAQVGRELRLSEEEEAQLKQLTQSLHANLSACYLKQDDWEKAVKYAAVVLESDPNNIKSMLRLGQAYHKLGDLMGADRILTKAASLHTKPDALGKALRETLKVVRGKIRQKERRLAHGMAEAMRAQASLEEDVVGGGGGEEGGDWEDQEVAKAALAEEGEAEVVGEDGDGFEGDERFVVEGGLMHSE